MPDDDDLLQRLAQARAMLSGTSGIDAEIADVLAEESARSALLRSVQQALEVAGYAAHVDPINGLHLLVEDKAPRRTFISTIATLKDGTWVERGLESPVPHESDRPLPIRYNTRTGAFETTSSEDPTARDVILRAVLRRADEKGQARKQKP